MNAVVVAASASDIGRVRKQNEDSYLVDEEHELFMVADGMGGHAAGEVASQSVVKRVRDSWTTDSITRHREAYAQKGGVAPRRSLLRAVREGVVAAHLDLMHQAAVDVSKHGMGTTFTGFLVAGGEAAFAHAGDSRAYLIRDGLAIQVSEDHTVVSHLLSLGANAEGETYDEEGLNQWRGQLTNALGTTEDSRVATFTIPLYSGDRIVLCTDGVYEYTDELEIAKIVTQQTPARAVNALVEQALERGGHDNATAIVVKIVEAGVTHLPKEQRDADERSIATSRLFCELTPQQLLRALRITTYRDIKADKPIAGIALGCRVAHVLLDGQVKTPRGKVLGPGDVVYPDALVFDTVWRENDAAVTLSEVRMLTIRCDDFFEMCLEERDLQAAFEKAVADLLSP